MNTGQMLLTIGALTLLSLMVLRVNNNSMTTTEILNESKYSILATSLATSMLEEAKNKSFDETSILSGITDVAGLTMPVKLGPEKGEITFDDFDDVDDFEGFTRTYTDLPSAIFDLKCEVDYVNPDNPDNESFVQTFHKRITVTVTNQSTTDSVKMSTIYSYWYFR